LHLLTDDRSAAAQSSHFSLAGGDGGEKCRAPMSANGAKQKFKLSLNHSLPGSRRLAHAAATARAKQTGIGFTLARSD
jgi:hypothetical protein